MSRRREIGFSLVVWLTAASITVASFPVSALTCCCKSPCTATFKANDHAASKAEPIAEPSHGCCKAKSSPASGDIATRACGGGCAKTTPNDNRTKPSGCGNCLCSTHPEPQSSEPTTAFGLIGSDFEAGFATNSVAMLPTMDLPSVGDISSCGTSPSTGPAQLVDLLTTLSRLTC